MALICVQSLKGQEDESFQIKSIGTPPIYKYGQEEVGQLLSNNSLTLDQHGRLYVASLKGVLMFDGQTWSTFRHSDDSYQDVVSDGKDRIYSITKSEFGYLYPEENGELSFESLKNINTKPFNSTQLKQVNFADNKVFFKSTEALLIYDPSLDTAFLESPKAGFGMANEVDGNYYIVNKEGLLLYEDQGMKALQGTKVLAENDVVEIIRFSEKELLIVTRFNGLFTYNFEELTPWKTDITAFIKEKGVSHAVNIRDEYFALATTSNGVLVVDKEGRLVQRLDEQFGVPNEQVFDLLVDGQGDLWIAQWEDLYQVMLSTSITTIDQRHGIEGHVYFTLSLDNTIYIGTRQGLYRKPNSKPWLSLTPEKPFQNVENLAGPIWSLYVKEKQLLAGGHKSIYLGNGDDFRSFNIGDQVAWAGVNWSNSPYMLFGTHTGFLHTMKKEDNGWVYKGIVKGFNHHMDYFAEQEDGLFWATDSGTEIFQFRLNADADSIVYLKKYTEADGLPATTGNRVFDYQGNLVFTTRNGVYKYNSEDDHFYESAQFKEALSNDYVLRFSESVNGNIFIDSDQRGNGLLRKTEEGFVAEFGAFNAHPLHTAEHVTSMDSDDFWIGGQDLKHYSPNLDNQSKAPFSALINRVSLSANDSTLFGGFGVYSGVELTPQQNQIRF